MSKDVYKTNMWPAFENVRKLQKSSILYRASSKALRGHAPPKSERRSQPAPSDVDQVVCQTLKEKLKLMFENTMGSPKLKV